MQPRTIFQIAAKGERVTLVPGQIGHALTRDNTLIQGYVNSDGTLQEIQRHGQPGEVWTHDDLLAFTEGKLADGVQPDALQEPTSPYLLDSFGTLWTAGTDESGNRVWSYHEIWDRSNGATEYKGTKTWEQLVKDTTPRTFWPCDTPVVNALNLARGPDIMIVNPTPAVLRKYIHGYTGHPAGKRDQPTSS